MRSFWAQAGEDREFDETLEKIGNDEYLVVWTDHFSPYVFVDKLNPEEKAALEKLQNSDGSNDGSNNPQNGAVITTDSHKANPATVNLMATTSPKLATLA